jgi:ribosome maturation factor RimP
MSVELQKLMDHVRDVAARENCLLYDLELVGVGRGRTLRVFIDKEGAEGVSIDDCSRVSRGLDLVLDVEDLVPGGSYHLEVSSPGLERQLRQPWHFEKVLGQTVLVHLSQGLGEFLSDVGPGFEKRKKLSGLLRQVSEQNIEVQLIEKQDQSFVIPFDKIQKARLVFNEEKNFGNKKPKGKEG